MTRTELSSYISPGPKPAENNDSSVGEGESSGSSTPVGLSALDASALLRWARQCVERLGQYRNEINALNVFPVPDSDTGTNLLHTMRAALARAEKESHSDAETGHPPAARDIALALGYGAVHGARGNSGIILSQVLRAVGESASFSVLDAVTLRRALRTAVTLVDHAVGDPVEGTIISVLRAAAAAAARSTASSLAEVASVAAEAAAEALERTPNQLPVLRRAGVVDAGGRGLLVLLDTFVEVLTGTAPKRRIYRGASGVSADSSHRVETYGPSVGPRFEVMYRLAAPEGLKVDQLRESLREIGDCVVVVGDGLPGPDANWSVHVHCDDVGAAIEAGTTSGRAFDIRVEDLITGPAALDDGSTSTSQIPAADSATAPRAVVAMVSRGPLAELFAEAGANTVDPRAAPDVVDAVLSLPGAELVVLPNGELSRAQLEEIDSRVRAAGRHILIVPTASVVQGLAALAVHDPTTSLSLDGFSMADAAQGTRHAHLIRARQDALTLVGRCQAGDILGMYGHDVALIDTDLTQALTRMVTLMLTSGGELLTLILGEEFAAAETAAVRAEIHTNHPDIDISIYHSGAGELLAQVGVE